MGDPIRRCNRCALSSVRPVDGPAPAACPFCGSIKPEGPGLAPSARGTPQALERRRSGPAPRVPGVV